MLRNVTVLFVLFLAAPSSFVQIRTWRDNTGKFTIEAEFVDVADGKVRLQKADGSLIAVPLERLSEADRRHVQSLATTSGEAAKSASKPESMTKKRGTTGRARNDQFKSGRESIERALDDRADLPQGDTSLKDMIHQLAAHHQIAILLDVKALDDAGIRANAKVTVREKGATLEETLNSSLKPMNLAWAVNHDVLAITTQEETKSCLETVVYKLLQPVDGVALLRDIGATIEPKNWDNVGGAGSRVAWPGGAVVISQTSTGHRQIAKQYAAALKRIFPGETRTTMRGKPSPLARLTAPVTCEYVEVPLGQVAADQTRQA